MSLRSFAVPSALTGSAARRNLIIEINGPATRMVRTKGQPRLSHSEDRATAANNTRVSNLRALISDATWCLYSVPKSKGILKIMYGYQ